ncbi:hypothetical protein D3C78_1675020 [compost metagenome]
MIDYDKELNAFFEEKKFENVKYISAISVQCGESLKCDILSRKGEYLYFDQSHFTLAGSKLFGEKLKTKEPILF